MKKLNKFSDNCDKLQFGDYILFQEYTQKSVDGKYVFNISKPIFSIYLGSFVADQALSFNYIKWINENHIEHVTNQYVTNCKVFKEVSGVESHYEWIDYVDILGIWKVRPNWKEIISKYRKKEDCDIMSEDDIDFVDL